MTKVVSALGNNTRGRLIPPRPVASSSLALPVRRGWALELDISLSTKVILLIVLKKVPYGNGTFIMWVLISLKYLFTLLLHLFCGSINLFIGMVRRSNHWSCFTVAEPF
jgi:hypothetical protein